MGILQDEEEIRLILLYKDLKGKASIPKDDINQRGRDHHSMAFQTPIASTDVYKL